MYGINVKTSSIITVTMPQQEGSYTNVKSLNFNSLK